ncbi:hypothetical protein KUV80_09765 [Fictibacillus nanhaiensis]|uniref:hypothetical protein n=1 Tax=Fictibacillus nanhaiensis TaxID=742169 RepID=UPI001C94DDFC|nr:hypothetical protein [Fictibacillus nanhaiensis]MBY6036942.1 hypothetical protein [Fictibacillus nanhaiensis]
MAMAPIMTPATGVYLEAAKPFKGLMGSVYMSNDIIFDNKTYKFVGIFPTILGKNLKRFLVMSEQGEVVKDKDMSWKCLRVYEFFVVVYSSEKLMIHLSQPDMDYLKELEPHIDDLFETLRGKVNNFVLAEFEKFKVFFSYMIKTDLIMHNHTKKILPQYKLYLNGKPFDYLNDFSDFHKEYIQFFELNCQRSIWLLEYALPRSVVSFELTTKENLKVLNSQQIEVAKNLVDFLRGCDQAEKDLAYKIPSYKNFEHSIRYLKGISGDFSIVNTDKSFKKWAV